MKTVKGVIPGLVIIACMYVPQSAVAQRFTSAGPAEVVAKTDTAGRNAKLAYEALKAGNIDRAREYLDDANPASPYTMFVQAALTKDAVTAADMYKEIVAANAGSPIAREALLQLYRYHYAAGQYAAAHQDYIELEKFPIPPPVSDPLGLQDSLQSIPAFQALPPAAGLSPAQASQEQAPPEQASAAQPPVYLVQVGVFTTADNARKFIQQLKIYGVNGKLFIKDIGGRRFYGVSAGSFSSEDAAEDLAKNLKSRSVQCLVVEQ
ncbi:MAG: SPOR domain-containing protein [Bacteroidetes bacterium]|nr:SPOR domain-containing protein [Bacteroidota bacterium]